MFNLMSSSIVPKRSHVHHGYDFSESGAVTSGKNLAQLLLCREAIDSCPPPYLMLLRKQRTKDMPKRNRTNSHFLTFG